MLKSIDVLLGFSLVMLVASMAVTVLTHIWTVAVNTRGVHLRNGLSAVIRQIDPQFSKVDAKAVIAHLLKHPLIAEGGRLGSLVHREEFTRLLLELAGGQGPKKLPELARRALAASLLANGIADPAAALSQIRKLALSLELSHPALTSAARYELAILHAASSEYVAKINGWFDATVDRVSARFAFTTRRIALANALLVAIAIQLDTVSIVERLCTDTALRATLVQQATAKSTVPAATLQDIERLAAPNILPIPANPADWLHRWTWMKLPGIALSVLLMSLGAPFWFEALKNLLRIRSAISVKDDNQRDQRQLALSSTVPSAPAPLLTSCSPIC